MGHHAFTTLLDTANRIVMNSYLLGLQHSHREHRPQGPQPNRQPVAVYGYDNV